MHTLPIIATSLPALPILLLLAIGLAGAAWYVHRRTGRADESPAPSDRHPAKSTPPAPSRPKPAPRRRTDAPVEKENNFRKQLPEYTRLVRQWLDEEHPYYNKSFKLMDVRQVIPLNRSYLSRLFNEGMGQSFSELVRDYRMREARRLLSEYPSLNIIEIAERCGFASHSSFHRTFMAMHRGQTPGQYRAAYTATARKGNEEESDEQREEI